MDPAFQRKGVDEGVVARLAVVDEHGFLGDVFPVGPHAGPVARLRSAHDEEYGACAVDGGGDVVLASPRKGRTGLGPGLFLDRVWGVEELLVRVDAPLQDDAPLDPLQDREHLEKPVSTGGFRIPVVRRGGLQRMVFEKVEEVFYPFRYRYLLGIEDRIGEGAEAPATAAAHESPDPVAAPPVPGDHARPAARASTDRYRIDEIDFLRRGFPVLLLIPFQNGGLYELFRIAFVLPPRPGKLPERRKARPLCFVFHVFGGRLFRGSVPGPPSQSTTIPGKGHCMPILPGHGYYTT